MVDLFRERLSTEALESRVAKMVEALERAADLELGAGLELGSG
jgi:hypothetical protein